MAQDPIRAGQPAGAFTTGGLLLETLRVWWRNALAFTAMAVLVEAPLLALSVRAGKDAQGSALDLLFVWVMNVVAVGALSHGVLRAVAGERASVRSMLGMLTGRLWPVFAVSGVYGALVLFAAWPGIPLLLPGILVLVVGFVSVPAVIAQPELGPLGALEKSAQLTRGHRLALLWAVVVLVGAHGGILLGCDRLLDRFPALAFPTSRAIFAGIDALLSGITGSCAAVAYHQLAGCEQPEAESVF